MRLFTVLLALTLTGSAQAESTDEFELSVVTLNLKFFGLGGSPRNDPEDEDRYYTVKRHMERNDLMADVIAFQEIVDIWGLKQRVLGDDYDCYSYSHSDPKHIHTVVCVRDYLRFRKASDDNNYIIDEVAMNRYRPAVHGVVETRRGRELAHIVNVHLKAHSNYSSVRAEQINIIAEYLENRRQEVPVILTGDFNTHAGDVSEFNNIFRSKRLDMYEERLDDWYTFRVPDQGYKFDRFWLSDVIGVETEPYVLGPCNAYGHGSTEDIEIYNRDVSDHCGVRIDVRVPYRR